MGLNSEQRAAADSMAARLVILAGAGTGKTSTLVARFQAFVQKDFSPFQILMLTFTRKAGEEMKARVRNALMRSADFDPQTLMDRALPISTYHSLACREIRQAPQAFGVPSGFILLDPDDCLQIWKQARKSLGSNLKSDELPAERVLSACSYAGNKLLDCGSHLHQVFADNGPLALRMAREAGERKKAIRAMDYDDLLLLFRQRLEFDRKYCDHFRERYPVVMVDEFQDNNPLQDKIIRLVNPRFLTLVGDVNQSIYSFRGSQPDLMLHWKNAPGTELVKLTQNYRSDQSIVRMANEIVKGREGAVNLVSNSSRAGECRLVAFQTVEDEAFACFNWVKERAPLGSVAVLSRTSNSLRQLEGFLTSGGVSYEMLGGNALGEKAEVRDFMAICRLKLNPRDTTAITRSFKILKGVGDRTAENYIREIAGDREKSDLFGEASRPPPFPASAQPLQVLMEFLGDPHLSFRKQIEAIHFFYLPHLKRNYPEDWEARAGNLDSLRRGALNAGNLENFCDGVVIDTAGEMQAGARVVLSTLHSAKGLEWRDVWVMGMGDAQVPHPRSVAEKKEDEERSLVYVAMTRGRNNTTVSYPHVLNGYRGEVYQDASRFLPSALVKEGSSGYGRT